MSSCAGHTWRADGWWRWSKEAASLLPQGGGWGTRRPSTPRLLPASGGEQGSPGRQIAPGGGCLPGVLQRTPGLLFPRMPPRLPTHAAAIANACGCDCQRMRLRLPTHAAALTVQPRLNASRDLTPNNTPRARPHTQGTAGHTETAPTGDPRARHPAIPTRPEKAGGAACITLFSASQRKKRENHWRIRNI